MSTTKPRAASSAHPAPASAGAAPVSAQKAADKNQAKAGGATGTAKATAPARKQEADCSKAATTPATAKPKSATATKSAVERIAAMAAEATPTEIYAPALATLKTRCLKAVRSLRYVAGGVSDATPGDARDRCREARDAVPYALREAELKIPDDADGGDLDRQCVVKAIGRVKSLLVPLAGMAEADTDGGHPCDFRAHAEAVDAALAALVKAAEDTPLIHIMPPMSDPVPVLAFAARMARMECERRARGEDADPAKVVALADDAMQAASNAWLNGLLGLYADADEFGNWILANVDRVDAVRATILNGKPAWSYVGTADYIDCAAFFREFEQRLRALRWKWPDGDETATAGDGDETTSVQQQGRDAPVEHSEEIPQAVADAPASPPRFRDFDAAMRAVLDHCEISNSSALALAEGLAEDRRVEIEVRYSVPATLAAALFTGDACATGYFREALEFFVGGDLEDSADDCDGLQGWRDEIREAFGVGHGAEAEIKCFGASIREIPRFQRYAATSKEARA